MELWDSRGASRFLPLGPIVWIAIQSGDPRPRGPVSRVSHFQGIFGKQHFQLDRILLILCEIRARQRTRKGLTGAGESNAPLSGTLSK